MKKIIITIIIIVILLVLLFPFKYRLKDGGSTVYKAILYQVTKVHRLYETNGIEEGWEIDIFGIRVYDNTTINVDVNAIENS